MICANCKRGADVLEGARRPGGVDVLIRFLGLTRGVDQVVSLVIEEHERCTNPNTCSCQHKIREPLIELRAELENSSV